MQTSLVSSFRSGFYHDGRSMIDCSPSVSVLTLKRSPKISLKGALTYIRISCSRLFTNFYELWVTYWWIFSCEIARHVSYLQIFVTIYRALPQGIIIISRVISIHSVWHWLASPRFTWSNSGIGLGHLVPLRSRPGSDRLQRLYIHWTSLTPLLQVQTTGYSTMLDGIDTGPAFYFAISALVLAGLSWCRKHWDSRSHLPLPPGPPSFPIVGSIFSLHDPARSWLSFDAWRSTYG
jgi:hypothetical protein